MPGYGSRGYQGRGQPSGGDIGRGSQPNRPSTSSNRQPGISTSNKVTSRKKEIDQIIKTQQDEKIDTWVPTKEIIPKEIDHGFDTIAQNQAYQDSLDRQKKMKKAIAMAYSTQQAGRGSTDPNDPDYNPNATAKEVSQFHNLTNAQKQFLIDSGFAAAESEGILGGTMGAELVMNDLKKQLQSATTNKEWQDAAAKINQLSGNKTAWMYDDPKYWSQEQKDWMQSKKLYDPAKGSALGYDPSAVYSWSDVESNPYLYKAHQELGSKDLTPDKYTDYMETIGAFGHMGTAPGGTGGGGGGGGGGYGGGGGGGDGYGFSGFGQDQMPQGYQRGQVGPGSLQEQVNQMYLGMSGAGMQKKRGGIVSLLRLR